MSEALSNHIVRLDAKIRLLEKENQELRIENEILKRYKAKLDKEYPMAMAHPQKEWL